MKISKNSVVNFDYKLTDTEGNLLDSSDGQPFAYIQGMGQIIRGLEEAMEGKGSGEEFNITIQPENAYGTYNEELVASIPKSQFDTSMDIQPGMQFNAEREGQYYTITVVEVQEEEVVVDGNHPLAGVVLNFDVKITDVRDATKEELEHGHVHGPGGHHH
ncbi:MAG: peptidylprolyl isomerase [Leptospiraceae bacterium]|nr:peptidylprolyl isomerase [Leptospiraceae bacterium]